MKMVNFMKNVGFCHFGTQKEVDKIQYQQIEEI